MPNRGAPTFTPGTSNQGLAAGYYAGGTVLGDQNLSPANILAGVSIFGVAGTLQPKQMARGRVTSSSSMQPFYQGSSPTANSNQYYVTVSGLSFLPSLIFLLDPNHSGGSAIYNSYTIYDPGASSTDYVWNAQANPPQPIMLAYGYTNTQNGSGGWSFQLQGPAYVNSSGFLLPVWSANTNYYWWAIR